MKYLCLLLLFVAAACSDNFAPASAVTDFRVVAAKVEVVGEPERANPSADEPVEVSLLAIDRGAPPTQPSLTPWPLQWAFVPCVPLPVTIGPPICLVPIEPCEGCVAAPPGDPLAEPEMMRFQVPSQAELDQVGAMSILFQGVVCSNGRPSEDALLRFLRGETEDLALCEGPPTVVDQAIEGRFLTVQIPLERNPADPNLQPEILSLLLNGAQWPPPYDQGVPRNSPGSGCAAALEGLTPEQRAAHPRAGDMSSSIDVSVTQQSLQTYTVDGVQLTEEIQVSWLADGGNFESTFSFITDPARSVLTQWEPFESAPEQGQLVRFNIVLRDGRGGTAWAERGLCVLPALAE